jgi:quinol monooxygenase YgiN
MYTVLRQYSGENASKLFDELEENAAEIEEIIRQVPGFVSYVLFRTPGGGIKPARMNRLSALPSTSSKT